MGSRPEVVLVRHGETLWTRGGKHTGRTDIPLTEEGRRQSERVGKSLSGRRLALVLTSPLQRAAETCRLAGLPPTEGRLFALDPATISILGHERETPVIRRWNEPDQLAGA